MNIKLRAGCVQKRFWGRKGYGCSKRVTKVGSFSLFWRFLAKVRASSMVVNEPTRTRKKLFCSDWDIRAVYPLSLSRLVKAVARVLSLKDPTFTVKRGFSSGASLAAGGGVCGTGGLFSTSSAGFSDNSPISPAISCGASGVMPVCSLAGMLVCTGGWGVTCSVTISVCIGFLGLE